MSNLVRDKVEEDERWGLREIGGLVLDKYRQEQVDINENEVKDIAKMLYDIAKDGSFWDLSKESDESYFHELLKREDPEILIGAPPCTAFRRLRELSRAKRDPAVVLQEEREGIRHVDVRVGNAPVFGVHQKLLQT